MAGEKTTPKGKKVKPALRQRVDPAQVEFMVAVAVQNQEAFDRVSQLLTVKHLDDKYEYLSLVWRLTQDHFERFGEMPVRGTLAADVQAAFAENEHVLGSKDVNRLNEFMEYAYDRKEHGIRLSKAGPHVQVAVETCRKFLEEQAVDAMAEAAAGSDRVPVDYPTILAEKQAELAQIQSLSAGKLDVPFPDGWHKREKVKLFTTGVSVLDSFMGGGWMAGECVLFMGPYGSCKTVLTINGVCGSLVHAESEFAKALKTDPKAKRPVVVLIFTEGTKDQYRMRLLSHLAQIPWKRLNQMESLADLSDANKPGACADTEYEKKLFGDFKADPDGEQSFRNERRRVKRAVRLCNTHLILIDATGSDSVDAKDKIGVGGMPQLGGFVRSHVSKHPDVAPLCFWIDHASALAQRMLEHMQATTDQTLRLLLKNIPRQAIDHLGRPFKAPVAIMHQLSGEANARSVTGRMHHTDAADCKGIAEYADFAVVTGKPDDHGRCVFDATKHRREPPHSYRTVQIEGAYNALRDVSHMYMVDPNSRKIKSKEEMTIHHGQKLVTEMPAADDETAMSES